MTRHAQRMQAAAAGLLGALLGGAAALADDTEVFVNPAAGAAQPNILLVLDTSGSMDALVQLPKPPYDPGRTYDGACAAGQLYFRRGPGDPPECNSDARLPAALNSCRAAVDALSGAAGLWSGRVAQWDEQSVQWGLLSAERGDAPLECEADAGVHGVDAASARRWARNGDDLNRWTVDELQQIDWSRLDVHTLYSANWLNWHHAPNEAAEATRLQTVQSVASAIVGSVDDVNLGLMRFSNTTGAGGDRAEGGMVTHAVTDLAVSRERLIEGINSYTAGGFTPLSETLFEAGQYLAGRSVVYGLNSTTDGVTPLPSTPESRRAEDQSRYRSPITQQCQRNYVILLTDGEPSHDNGADARIAALPDFRSLVGNGCDGSGPGRCLDDMAAWLHEADLSDLPGRQNAITYTIGFGPEVAGSATLERVAARGGGAAYSAGNYTELAEALQNIVGDILRTGSTFTTPSVAVNAFNRTQTLGELYISVFRPETTLHWPGNLKKYGLRDGRIVDLRGLDVVDPGSGFFRDGTQDFWSPLVDGGRVDAGGALSRLPNPPQRRLLTYLGANPPPNAPAPLVPLDASNAELTDAVLGTDAAITRAQLIAWARGTDAPDRDGDGDTTEPAPFMGDPLHARPAVVAYGGSVDAADARDVVVFVPTNDGYLHAVDARTGRELWSFVPPELLSRLVSLYRNPGVAARSYGLDGDVRVLKFDVNQDGIVTAAEGDRVWIYFGMRRGGRFYYALDVTDRGSPRLKWRLGPADLPGIGETWSTPAVTRVRIGGAAQNGEHLVLVFGGGYDDSQENYAYTTDDSGHRLFMVDAASGALLWYAGGPGGAGEPDLRLAHMTHSIPSRISVLDIDGDRFADRMYAADLGGRVWRFDIWNGNARGSLVTGGVFARLGAGDDDTPTTQENRRFYYAPDVALIQRRGADPYYNLAIGSGYRGHPLHTETRDRFYTLRDRNPFGKLAQAAYDAAAPISESDLIDITDALDTAVIPSTARGWRLELRLDGGWVGEKVLAEALTVNGVVMFPTYQPVPPDALDPCVPANGINRVYALQVDTGRPAVDFSDDQSITAIDVSTRLVQTGIASEVGFALETVVGAGGGSGSDGSGDGGGGGADGSGRDALGRRSLCYVGVEVLRKCVQPGGVVRTFWERTAEDAGD